MRGMIAVIILVFLFLNNVLELDKEYVYKIMIALCLVSLLPIAAYAIYSMTFGELDTNILLLMTML
ncbi:MAG: hypothetical protein JSW00_11375 [Thermoplasmata archaeon]|nr:MAG: hypothetical protein JSW00_11375 [Thermoplasmata archaeon]